MSERLSGEENFESFLAEDLALELIGAQGPWDEQSKNLQRLQFEKEFFPDGGFNSKRTGAEKAVEKILRPVMMKFLSEGNMARVILGHSIMLPKEDRGLILLGHLIDRNSEQAGYFINHALITEEVARGVAIEDIASRSQKGFLGLIKLFVRASSIVKKFFPKERVDSLDDKENSEMIKELESPSYVEEMKKLYGDSPDLSREKKSREALKFMANLKTVLIPMDAEKRGRLLNSLKAGQQDPIIAESLESAREILQKMVAEDRILQRKFGKSLE